MSSFPTAPLKRIQRGLKRIEPKLQCAMRNNVAGLFVIAVGGEETPMSEYLNQLIRALQAQVDQERCALDRNRAKGLRESKDEGAVS